MIRDIEWIIADEELTYKEKTLRVVAYIEDIGMLPPPSTCKLIPDNLKGGVKHSEVKHEWDDE